MVEKEDVYSAIMVKLVEVWHEHYSDKDSEEEPVTIRMAPNRMVWVDDVEDVHRHSANLVATTN